MRSSSPPPGGNRPGGKKPYRPGGPRPSTPRPPEDKRARGKGAPRDGKPRDEQRGAPRDGQREGVAPVPERQRNPERPVLSLATAPAPVQSERPQGERPQGERPAGKRRPFVPNRKPRDDGPMHDPDQPKGTIWLYGLHAVAAALQNPHRRLRRLLLTEEAELALAGMVGRPWPISSENTERARIDQLLGRDAVHQGVALLADPLSSPGLTQVLEQRSGPVIVLDQLNDPRNIGAILRSAQAFGACCVITQDRNAPDESGALAKAASGALERIPLLRAVNIARTLVALKAAGCWCIGLDASGAPLSGKALSERRVALVMGSEGEGMRRLTRETCDELVGIPMPGSAGTALDSLNVSAAATVALYELTRR